MIAPLIFTLALLTPACLGGVPPTETPHLVRQSAKRVEIFDVAFRPDGRQIAAGWRRGVTPTTCTSGTWARPARRNGSPAVPAFLGTIRTPFTASPSAPTTACSRRRRATER